MLVMLRLGCAASPAQPPPQLQQLPAVSAGPTPGDSCGHDARHGSAIDAPSLPAWCAVGRTKQPTKALAPLESVAASVVRDVAACGAGRVSFVVEHGFHYVLPRLLQQAPCAGFPQHARRQVYACTNGDVVQTRELRLRWTKQCHRGAFDHHNDNTTLGGREQGDAGGGDGGGAGSSSAHHGCQCADAQQEIASPTPPMVDTVVVFDLSSTEAFWTRWERPLRGWLSARVAATTDGALGCAFFACAVAFSTKRAVDLVRTAVL